MEKTINYFYLGGTPSSHFVEILSKGEYVVPVFSGYIVNYFLL